jgi:hypothetical protein
LAHWYQLSQLDATSHNMSVVSLCIHMFDQVVDNEGVCLKTSSALSVIDYCNHILLHPGKNRVCYHFACFHFCWLPKLCSNKWEAAKQLVAGQYHCRPCNARHVLRTSNDMILHGQCISAPQNVHLTLDG